MEPIVIIYIHYRMNQLTNAFQGSCSTFRKFSYNAEWLRAFTSQILVIFGQLSTLLGVFSFFCKRVYVSCSNFIASLFQLLEVEFGLYRSCCLFSLFDSVATDNNICQSLLKNLKRHVLFSLMNNNFRAWEESLLLSACKQVFLAKMNCSSNLNSFCFLDQHSFS